MHMTKRAAHDAACFRLQSAAGHAGKLKLLVINCDGHNA